MPFRFLTMSALGTALVSPSTLHACATCFGQSDEAMARGMNMGILALLICIIGVLFGMVGVGIFLVRRAARVVGVTPANDPGEVLLPVEQTLK